MSLTGCVHCGRLLNHFDPVSLCLGKKKKGIIVPSWKDCCDDTDNLFTVFSTVLRRKQELINLFDSIMFMITMTFRNF